jgi:hypothetical protein
VRCAFGHALWKGRLHVSQAVLQATKRSRRHAKKGPKAARRRGGLTLLLRLSRAIRRAVAQAAPTQCENLLGLDVEFNPKFFAAVRANSVAEAHVGV